MLLIEHSHLSAHGEAGEEEEEDQEEEEEEEEEEEDEEEEDEEEEDEEEEEVYRAHEHGWQDSDYTLRRRRRMGRRGVQLKYRPQPLDPKF